VACLADYAARPTTAWEHAAEIRRIYGYRDFTEPAESFRLVRWLYTRAWLSSEQPSVLFDLATARMVERQVLLPGVSILARLVARIRERANARLHRKLARMLSAEQRAELKELLVVPAGARRSALDRLRRGPTQPTAAGLVEALRRLDDVRELGVSELDLSGIPAGRLRLLARFASTARAQAIQRMPAERGIATLLAFASALQASAQDDVLDVLDMLLTDLLARVDSQEKRRRLRTIGDLDVAALLLRDVGLLVIDLAKPDQTLRNEIFTHLPRERIERAVATVAELARPPENQQAPEALLSRYSLVRQFLPLLLKTITPRAADGGRAVLAGWEFLDRIERMTTPPMHERRCASSRRPGDAWWCTRTGVSTAVPTPSVCCRRCWRRSNGATCSSRQANGGEIQGHSCLLAWHGRLSAHPSAARWDGMSCQNPNWRA